jgi:aldose 1-epimerase
MEKHLENGFPGDFECRATFSLADGGALRIDYVGTCSSNTVVNLTNHSYFNLNGNGVAGNIDNHDLQINASFYTPVGQLFRCFSSIVMTDTFFFVDETLIPTGEILKVEGTELDFRSFANLGERFEKIKGYDVYIVFIFVFICIIISIIA